MPPKRKKSKKRVARGKKLARTLPRDTKGRFLPKGSKNLFRKKRATKRRRRRSVPATRRTAAPKRRRRLSLPPIRNRSRAMPRRSLTKDVFPNFMSGKLSQVGAILNVFTTVRVQTPIPRLKVSGNRATVMELLWCDLVVTGGFPDGNANFYNFSMSIGTPPDAPASASFDRPTVFLSLKTLATGTTGILGARMFGLFTFKTNPYIF